MLCQLPLVFCCKCCSSHYSNVSLQLHTCAIFQSDLLRDKSGSSRSSQRGSVLLTSTMSDISFSEPPSPIASTSYSVTGSLASPSSHSSPPVTGKHAEKSGQARSTTTNDNSADVKVCACA